MGGAKAFDEIKALYPNIDEKYLLELSKKLNYNKKLIKKELIKKNLLVTKKTPEQILEEKKQLFLLFQPKNFIEVNFDYNDNMFKIQIPLSFKGNNFKILNHIKNMVLEQFPELEPVYFYESYTIPSGIYDRNNDYVGYDVDLEKDLFTQFEEVLEEDGNIELIKDDLEIVLGTEDQGAGEDYFENILYIQFPGIIACNALIFMKNNKVIAAWHISGYIAGGMHRNEKYPWDEYNKFVSTFVPGNINDYEVYCCGRTTKFYGHLYKPNNEKNTFFVSEDETMYSMETLPMSIRTDDSMGYLKDSSINIVFDVLNKRFFLN